MTLHLNLIIQNNQFHFIPKSHLHFAAEYYDGREHSNMLPRATPKNTIEFIICS